MLQMRRHASVESGSGGRTELLTINKYSRFNNVLEERMVHPSISGGDIRTFKTVRLRDGEHV